jgi:hypothetical protein
MYSTKQLVSSNKELEQLVSSKQLTSFDIQNRALGIAEGLTSIVEPNNMTAWYCKAYKTLGEHKYSALVSMAKQGRNPKALFGWLLKQELNK